MFIPMAILWTLFITILQCPILIPIYIAYEFARKKFNEERMSQIDFKNETYYREIIKKLSPAILSYIDDFKLEKKDVVATILLLEIKNKIRITNSIEIIDYSSEGLTEAEKYVFDVLIQKNMNEFNMIGFESIVKNECVQNNLLRAKQGKFNKIMGIILIFLVILGPILFSNMFNIFEMIDKNLNDQVAIMTLILITLLYMGLIIGCVASIIMYFIMKLINPYVRSNEGDEINKKIEGLKKYMKDYSNFEQKNKEDITLWEDYLIYSIIFGINTQIVEEVWEKICQ